MFTFLHKYASPQYFYSWSANWQKWSSVIAVLLMSVGLYYSLLNSPADYQQGETVRIMYVHVPAAWLSMFTYMVMAAAAIVALIWRIKVAEIMIGQCAFIGASFTALALITGMLWGKPMWGAYWVWDARLTSELVLLFLYFGVIALSGAFEDERTGARAAAILTLVGIVNIPIIHYSVEWWNTLHQPASFGLTQKPAMPSEMWLPLLVIILGFYAFAGFIVLVRMRTEILNREMGARWVRDWVQVRSER